MAWKVEWDNRAIDELKKLDKEAARRILKYLRERIEGDEDPRRFGKALASNKAGLWRYRIGDCRVICQIEDSNHIVFVVKVGHRSDIYD